MIYEINTSDERESTRILHSSVKTFSHLRTDVAIIIVGHLLVEYLEVIAIDTLTGIEAPRLYVSECLLNTTWADTCSGSTANTGKKLRKCWVREIMQNLSVTLQRSDGSFEVSLQDFSNDCDAFNEIPRGLEPLVLKAEVNRTSEANETDELPTPTLNYMARQFDRLYTKPANIRLLPIADRFNVSNKDYANDSGADDYHLENNPWFIKKHRNVYPHENPLRGGRKSTVHEKFKEYRNLTEQSLFRHNVLDDIQVPSIVGPFPRDTHGHSSNDDCRSYSCDSISTLTDDDSSYKYRYSARISSFFSKQLAAFAHRAVNAAGAVLPKSMTLFNNRVHVC